MTRTVLDRDTRRRQLLEAATGLFAKKGYRSTSVSDIIDAAGVARGTFYLYFRSKRDVFLSIIEDYRTKLALLIQSIGEQEGEVTPENCQERLRQNVRAWLEFFAHHRAATKIALREANAIDPQFERKRRQIREVARRHLVERYGWLQNAGLFSHSITPEALALFSMGMLDEVVASYILPARKPDLDWLSAQWLEFVWKGVRPAR